MPISGGGGGSYLCMYEEYSKRKRRTCVQSEIVNERCRTKDTQVKNKQVQCRSTIAHQRYWVCPCRCTDNKYFAMLRDGKCSSQVQYWIKMHKTVPLHLLPVNTDYTFKASAIFAMV